jgi:hypothetical protein
VRTWYQQKWSIGFIHPVNEYDCCQSLGGGHAVLVVPVAKVLVPLPHIPYECPFQVDLELIDIDVRTQQSLSWGEYFWVPNEPREELIGKVRPAQSP